MNPSLRSQPITVVRAWPLLVLAVISVLDHSQPARAQSPIIAVGPPSFQTLAGPSLEDEILYRLTFLGPREPGDEMQLARLAELRSIATLASIQNDLRGSVTDGQVERDAFALWSATDAFDQAVRYLPADTQNLARAQLALNDVESAVGRLNSTLGAVPSLSPRGAFYLEGISQILPLAQSQLQAIEAAVVPPAPVPATQFAGLAELREMARLLASDLAGLIREINASPGDERAREADVGELRRLFELVSGFDRLLALGPTRQDVWESFRQVLRSARPARAALIRIGRPETWRALRDRLNVISDGLQLPRAIGSREAERPLWRGAAGVLRVIDQASDRIAAAVAAQEPTDSNEPRGPLGNQARRLQIKLLELRQSVLAADSIDELGSRLREIEVLTQQLATRAPKGPAVYRGGRREGVYNLTDVDTAISQLRGLLSSEVPARRGRR